MNEVIANFLVTSDVEVHTCTVIYESIASQLFSLSHKLQFKVTEKLY